jgi:hypothetical protein
MESRSCCCARGQCSADDRRAAINRRVNERSEQPAAIHAFAESLLTRISVVPLHSARMIAASRKLIATLSARRPTGRRTSRRAKRRQQRSWRRRRSSRVERRQMRRRRPSLRRRSRSRRCRRPRHLLPLQNPRLPLPLPLRPLPMPMPALRSTERLASLQVCSSPCMGPFPSFTCNKYSFRFIVKIHFILLVTQRCARKSRASSSKILLFEKCCCGVCTWQKVTRHKQGGLQLRSLHLRLLFLFLVVVVLERLIVRHFRCSRLRSLRRGSGGIVSQLRLRLRFGTTADRCGGAGRGA